jgi:hypothetical protein
MKGGLNPSLFAIEKLQCVKMRLDSFQSSQNEEAIFMQLIQTVVVKQILTEHSKQQLFDNYQEKMLQLKKESDQLQFELKRLEKTKTFSPGTLKKQFEKEIQIRQEKAKLLEFQIEQLHILPLGSELREKEVQALVEINIGDEWDKRMGQTTIIIKDGKIEEIR